MKEYKLTIQAAGSNEADAVAQAVRMLNEGANFDKIVFLYDDDDLVPIAPTNTDV